MTKLNSIVRFLNNDLKIRSIKDKSRNGLQVRGSKDVKRIGLSVDACMDVFQKAKRKNCDMVIVHHGIFWKGGKDTAGMIKKQVNFLKKNKISAYAAHLPLDKNAKYGNNIILFKMLGAKKRKLFGLVGYIGYLPKPKSTSEIVKILRAQLKTKYIVHKFGKTKNISKVAIVSGYGGLNILTAVKEGADLFLTGEISHSSVVKIRDSKLTVIEGGHYATETLGVKALGKLLEEKYGVKTVFLDAPTGM